MSSSIYVVADGTSNEPLIQDDNYVKFFNNAYENGERTCGATYLMNVQD